MKKLTFILVTFIFLTLVLLNLPAQAQISSAENPVSFDVTVVGEITVINNCSGNLEAFFLGEEIIATNSSDPVRITKHFKVVFDDYISEDKLFILKWSKLEERPIAVKVMWGFDSTIFHVQDINYSSGLTARASK